MGVTCPFTQYLSAFALPCRTKREAVGCSPIPVYPESVMFSLPEAFSFFVHFLVALGPILALLVASAPRAAFTVRCTHSSIAGGCVTTLLPSCPFGPSACCLASSTGACRDAVLSMQILSLHMCRICPHNLWGAPLYPRLDYTHPLGADCPLPPQQVGSLCSEPLAAIVTVVKQLNFLREQQRLPVSLCLALTTPPALPALLPPP